MLEVKNLRAKVADSEDGDAEILRGINLSVKAGEIHAIMGPNGSGKSTLANVLAGRPDYEITDGSIAFDGDELAELSPDERAVKGLFMASQYPPEIPGVKPWQFLKLASDTLRKSRGEVPLNVREFSKQFEDASERVGLSKDLMKRALNEGFSGGEKKRNEILQMLVLQPRLVILDETDSGLDVDALKLVGAGVNQLRDASRSFVVITHYHRILDQINPDRVHVLSDGVIVRSGDSSLALEIEKSGYAPVLEQSS